MKSVVRILKFAFDNFGPLIVFYAVNRSFGLRSAVVASAAISALEIVWKFYRKAPFTGFFKFSVVVTVVFGVLDLWVKTPIFFRYEASLSNVVTGVYFGMTVRSAKSFIQEWIEKRDGKPMTDADAILRCRMLTVVWTAYFFAKAGIYGYLSTRYSMEEAMLIRSTAGTASFYALLALSIFAGRPVLVFLQSRGLLPMAAAPRAN